MAIKLIGNWDRGLAYDIHVLESIYLGPDEFGHDRFENTRSEMGDLVYRLKYSFDLKALKKISVLLDQLTGIENHDCILPMAASNRNRPFQPVTEIAKALGERRGVAVFTDNLVKVGNTPQLKNVASVEERQALLKQTLRLTAPEELSGKKVLVVDDLYRSGDSLRAATDLLREAGAEKVSVLTMTKTRNG